MRRRDPARVVAHRLVEYAYGSPRHHVWLTEWLRRAAMGLAHDGVAPRRGARGILWRAVVTAAAELRDSQVRRLATRSFLDKARLEALAREGRSRRPWRPSTGSASVRPGPELQRLAVDPLLTRAASRALGYRVEPAFVAVYVFDMPRSNGRPHLDNAPFEIIVHIVLEHSGLTNRRGGSALVVHRPRRDVRLTVAPGQAVVLSGRGAVHQWERLGAREQRTLIAIGFRCC